MEETAQLFEERWNFPHCLGATDGEHNDAIPPVESGPEFYNYKGGYSMVLLAIVDAKYQFISVPMEEFQTEVFFRIQHF